MNIVFDKETRIVGLGLTQEEAYTSMKFYVERSGKITQEREKRRKKIHAWLPKENVIHVTGIGAVMYEKNYFVNLLTGRKVRMHAKALAHYLDLFSAFDGRISFEDFTLTIAPEVNEFLANISDKFQTLNDFPYINPVENIKIKSYHQTLISNVSIIETMNDTIVLMDGSSGREVSKTVGVDAECLLSYLFASSGYCYDGNTLTRCNTND